MISKCFHVADLFGKAATQGFVNQSKNVARISGGQDRGIEWQLRNLENYDPQANYSRILYRQHTLNPSGNEAYEPGAYANRRINVYGGFNCTQLEPDSDTGILPWYGFNCWSEEEGTCGTLPYSIASFTMLPLTRRESEAGTCLSFAKDGTAAGNRASYEAVMGVFTGATLALWFVS